MNEELRKLAELHRKKGVMNHWTLCMDCPYPSKGFVCWSRNHECLRTRMMVLNGHGDEVAQISRVCRERLAGRDTPRPPLPRTPELLAYGYITILR